MRRAPGRLAGRLGNELFAAPMPYQPTLNAISMHDSGWPLHDREPTLNAQGLPLHVLESPAQIATKVWSESVRRAAEAGDYCGLLVSLHVLRLSARAGARSGQQPPADMFEINKFQHRQIELQEEFRGRLGMRTDLPLELGLARPGGLPEEDLLGFNFHLLRLLDAVSLDACCSEEVFQSLEGVLPRPGNRTVAVKFHHPAPFTIGLDSWPFDSGIIEVPIACRRVSAMPFTTRADFLEAYDRAPVEQVTIRVVHQR